MRSLVDIFLPDSEKAIFANSPEVSADVGAVPVDVRDFGVVGDPGVGNGPLAGFVLAVPDFDAVVGGGSGEASAVVIVADGEDEVGVAVGEAVEAVGGHDYPIWCSRGWV